MVKDYRLDGVSSLTPSSYALGGHRRTGIDIIRDILELLLKSHGPVSMTSLMNRSNLNQVSFKRYMSMLQRARIVRVLDAGNAGSRRRLYAPTAAAKRLYALFLLIRSVLSGSSFADRLEALVERARRELEESGARVVAAGTLYDIVAVTPSGETIGVIVADPEGTWSIVAPLALDAGKGEKAVLYSPDGDPVRLRVVRSLSRLEA